MMCECILFELMLFIKRWTKRFICVNWLNLLILFQGWENKHRTDGWWRGKIEILLDLQHCIIQSIYTIFRRFITRNRSNSLKKFELWEVGLLYLNIHWNVSTSKSKYLKLDRYYRLLWCGFSFNIPATNTNQILQSFTYRRYNSDFLTVSNLLEQWNTIVHEGDCKIVLKLKCYKNDRMKRNEA